MGKPIRYEELLIQLAVEFKKRDMQAHLSKLRVYYVDLKQRKRAAMERPIGEEFWTEDAVVHMLCQMRLPPFHHVYEPRARCTCGADRKRAAYGLGSLGEIGMWACIDCKSVWLSER